MILEWAAATFGRIALHKEERVLRFIEEAVELAQANDLPVDKLHAVVDYVYAKPKGDVTKEAGAVGTTLLALCELHNISADDAERNEAERIVKMDPAYFRERHNKKAAGGIAAFTDTKEEG
jgi:NTP pyrophosphatase (non-canonical NTP hydrolase)